MMVVKYKQKYRSISAASWRWFCFAQHVKYKQFERASACVSVIVAIPDSWVNYELWNTEYSHVY